MGGAWNQKLGGQRAGKTPRQGGNTWCVGQISTLFSFLCASKNVAGSRGRAPIGESGGQSVAETLLAFGRAVEAVNLPAFYAR